MTKQNNGFMRFAMRSLRRLWAFKFVIAFVIAIPAMIFQWTLGWAGSNGDTVITTANLGQIIGWRLPVVLAVSLFFAFCCIWLEIFSQICFCDGLLSGGKCTVFSSLKKGFRVCGRFLDPAGILIVLYLLISAPICGLGFTLQETEDLYIPNFIQHLIVSNPLYLISEIVLIALFLYVDFRYIFTFHAAVIDGKKPGEALKESRRLTRLYWKKILKWLIRFGAISFLAIGFMYVLLQVIPGMWILDRNKDIPRNYEIRLLDSPEGLELTQEDREVIAFRIGSAFWVVFGNYAFYIVISVSSICMMLAMTRLYYELTGKQPEYGESGGALKRAAGYTGAAVLFLTFLAVVSLVLGVFYDYIFVRRDPIPVIAHRTGGILASENSLEGIALAAEHGCYGSETDIQRTKDGHYIINHDTTFERLTGNKAKPGELTLDEIRKLRIRDTTGNGELLTVPTMEELLDAGKDRDVLFLELKGESADPKMADDIVVAVRERNMTDQVVLISLNAETIDYAERTYPEFETGLLIFGAFGDVSGLNCDVVIMEEEMTDDIRIINIHQAGKKAVVWTVNTWNGLETFLDKNIDGIITDQVEMAMETEKRLQERSDYEILAARLEHLFR